jgi:hypothetical protein
MISVLMCSIAPAKFAAAEVMYSAALGAEPWELIGIHDAKSLAEGYTRAIAASKGEILVFSHDDVQIFSGDLPGKLRRHLQRFDLIGVAGTSRLINGGWNSAGPPHVFGQVVHRHPDGKLVLDIFCAPRAAVGSIQALDGVFMAARRPVVQKISFDAVTFDGFHVYDVDFSFQAYRAGLKLGVACDIHLFHQSYGKFDESWKIYAARFVAKWQEHLAATAPPLYQWSIAQVDSWDHATELMTPVYWNYEG